MKFEIKNRWSGEIQFEAEIECAVNARVGVKIGLAVKWAYETGADLTGYGSRYKRSSLRALLWHQKELGHIENREGRYIIPAKWPSA